MGKNQEVRKVWRRGPIQKNHSKLPGVGSCSRRKGNGDLTCQESRLLRGKGGRYHPEGNTLIRPGGPLGFGQASQEENNKAIVGVRKRNVQYRENQELLYPQIPKWAKRSPARKKS